MATISSTARTDRPSADDAVRQEFLGLRVARAARRARACPALSTPAATRRCTLGGKFGTPDRIGDVRPQTTDLPGQLLVGSRSHRVAADTPQLLPMRSAAVDAGSRSERSAQHVAIGRSSRTIAGTTSQFRQLASAPPALAHHKLILAIGDLANHDRLQQPDCLDRVGQLGQGLFVENLPWLTRVRGDRVDRHLVEVRSGNRTETRRASLQRLGQRSALLGASVAPIGVVGIRAPKTLAQTPLLLRHVPLLACTH